MQIHPCNIFPDFFVSLLLSTSSKMSSLFSRFTDSYNFINSSSDNSTLIPANPMIFLIIFLAISFPVVTTSEDFPQAHSS